TRKAIYKPEKMNKLVNQNITKDEKMDEQEYITPHEEVRKDLIRMYHRTATIYSEAHLDQPEERNKKTIESKEERNEVLERQHAFGHFGAIAMEKAIHADGMHWPNLRQDAINMLQSPPAYQEITGP
ncbi:hypothetical protein, partial, partial [Absidia glauca]